MPEYDVFISYRREVTEYLSRTLYEKLSQDGYRVFYDVENIQSGRFNAQILESIAGSKTMIIVLPPHGLDRCADPEDWVRREVEYAMERGMVLILVLMPGFDWESARPLLPDSLRALPEYQSITADNSLFGSWYTRLKTWISREVGAVRAPSASQIPQAERDQALERGMEALKDGDFDMAGMIFDAILARDCFDARAWLGKALAEEELRDKAGLAEVGHPLEDSLYFMRAKLWADPALRAELLAAADTVRTRLAREARLAEERRRAEEEARRRFAARCEKGKYFTFGEYPQTRAGNDRTPIQWIVLDVRGTAALLISRDGLDAVPFHTERSRELFREATWETCSLRKWLNGEFLETAFNEAEREAILETAVENGREQGSGEWMSRSWPDTRDKVFLLSCAQARAYFSADGDRICRATAYAAGRKAWVSADNGCSMWWLRSPAGRFGHVMRVLSGGDFGSRDAVYDKNTVRPALWVDMIKCP